MIYGYCRVSSKKQFSDGNGLDVQRSAILSKYCNAEIHEEQYTGKTTNRPVFNKLIEKLQAGDRLVIHKIDRFARSTIEGIKLMDELSNKGVVVEILNFGNYDEEISTANKLMFKVLLAFAEYERELIVQRTQEGKRIAKEKAEEENRVFKEGRPRGFDPARIEEALKMLTVNGGDKSYKQVAHLTGISVKTLCRRQQEYRNNQQ